MNKNKRVLIIAIVLIFSVGGFMYLQQKSSPPMSPEIKKAQQQMMANCKYDADFCKYAANGIVAMAGGYTMISESTYNGKVSKMVMKSDGQENFESVSYSNGKEEGRFISLNKTTYMRNVGEKEWLEYPALKDEVKNSTTLFNFEGLKKELGDITKDTNNSLIVKKVGTEACGKVTCSVFEMTEKDLSNLNTKIWIDTREYLARKMETKTEYGISTMTFEYGPVTITKPSPVKKMPAFDSPAVNNGGVNINSEEIQKLMKQVPPIETQEAPPGEETPVK